VDLKVEALRYSTVLSIYYPEHDTDLPPSHTYPMQLRSLLLLFLLPFAAQAGNRMESIKLWAAAWNGDAASVKSGLSAGADPNWLNKDDDDKGHTAVTAAAKRGHVDVLAILLGLKDIDVCVRDSKGISALDFAVKREHAEVADALKAHIEKHPCVEDAKASGGWFGSWFGGKDL
jgi:hypothetical protein